MFKQATGYDPYPYQIRVAEADRLPDLIEAPTGVGKTECAILAWIWRRKFSSPTIRSSTPRRIIYCLPMRTLVEQTQRRVESWLKSLGMTGPEPSSGTEIQLAKLIGGEVWRDWDTGVEKDQVIIGTQDMLLSRALNRGYAMSRFRWPLHFGLFNNDCLWIIDEPQLMGVGLQTSAQMQWFRERFGTFGPSHTIWMSATISPDWLRTVDALSDRELNSLSITEEDEHSTFMSKRIHAQKRVTFSDSGMGDVKGLASEILAQQDGWPTLIVVNTVKRAKELYIALSSNKDTKVLLLHSHFRPPDRESLMNEVLGLGQEMSRANKAPIVVSTQVIEAGMDISVKRLYTELAPWSSMVQRFGRCNRRGEHEEGEIIVIRPKDHDLEKLSAPYEPNALSKALNLVSGLEGVFDSSTLPKDFDEPEALDIIRSVDVIDLFDTTSDMFGNATDVTRFVRAAKDTNVQVFWRDMGKDGPANQPFPNRKEICPAPVKDLRDLMRKGRGGYFQLDYGTGEWTSLREWDIRPGALIMISSNEGRYSPEMGWDASVKRRVPVLPLEAGAMMEGFEHDDQGQVKTIIEHSQDVRRVADRILEEMMLPIDVKGAVRNAALWHDSGKAHWAFQAVLGNDDLSNPLAKSRNMIRGKALVELAAKEKARRYFRHELVSALICMDLGMDFLVAYMVAAHHGKVRVSIRAVPGETGPMDGSRFARGVWEGDTVIVPFEDGERRDITVDLSMMDIGGGNGRPSWTEQVIALRDSEGLGPFRLAFLEALLKSADERASGGE